ncbi:MAG: ankyrin repeat domain-containing protein [Chloroflexi bacterium]|nr:MAG: ankyrin repeat domain-containing protein [Chloroflexota bacterium]TMC27268.1 MAG: ankyrin repeat domain-containing protein [Chloroflexota bacterium]TMC57849.1 MAG: ankyrin repeat domain-containing protein [Chloroflexota bacterium]
MSAEFLAAVKRGDRDTVEKMLRSDPRLLETRDENGTSALLLSYYHGKAEIANSLLSHRPDLDIFEAATVGDAARIRELAARDAAVIDRVAQDGFHPLGLAAFFKRPEAVRALLDLGANVRPASRNGGFTALHSAVADDTGSAVKEIVRMLLDAGADPNAQSASGGTPLHTAAFTGDVAVVEMLVAAGADPEITDKKGQTPLDYARERKNSEAAAVLHDTVTDRRRG